MFGFPELGEADEAEGHVIGKLGSDGRKAEAGELVCIKRFVSLEVGEEVHLGGVRSWKRGLVGIFGFGALGFGLGFDGVEFEVGEDRFGALHDDFWQTGEARDLDAVGFVGSAGENLVEEDDFLIPLADGDIVVGDGALGIREVG